MIKMNSIGNKIDIETIKLLESFIEYGLTKSYREFLLKYNGGEIEPNTFKLSEGENSLSSFFQINSKETDEDLVCNYKLYIDRTPLGYIPIADDHFGNLILLCLKGKNREKVYFWDHEFEVDDGENPNYENMTLIANNFQEFLENLK